MSIPSFQFNQGFKARGGGLPFHAHEEAQLTYAASGTVQVHTDEGRWLVPPQLAVWIPAGVQHRVDVLADAELWMVHWVPSAAIDWAPSLSLGEAFAFRVTPLMQALLTAAFKDNVHGEKAELVAKLMLHELTMTAHAPTFLPMPSSADGLRVAEIALADHRGALSVDELASRAATSVRSLSRRFSSETGLSFKAWRQRARIVQAMDHLSRRTPVARVAAHFGFSSSASFSHAFRQVTNLTPTAFLSGASS